MFYTPFECYYNYSDFRKASLDNSPYFFIIFDNSWINFGYI